MSKQGCEMTGGYEKDIAKWYVKPPKYTHLQVKPLTKDESNNSMRERAYNAIMNKLEEQGDGARGYFGVNFM